MEQVSTTILDYITAIGSIATPIFVLILTGIGWLIANRYNKAREIEEKLRDDRIKIYNSILEPFILILYPEEHFGKIQKYKNKNKSQVVLELVLSIEYRQAGFKLSLIGSDEVIQSYNNLMQHFYSMENIPEKNLGQKPKEVLKYFGTFLLAIRKNIGNKSTKLKYHEMLEYMIKDIRNYIND